MTALLNMAFRLIWAQNLSEVCNHNEGCVIFFGDITKICTQVQKMRIMLLHGPAILKNIIRYQRKKFAFL